MSSNKRKALSAFYVPDEQKKELERLYGPKFVSSRTEFDLAVLSFGFRPSSSVPDTKADADKFYVVPEKELDELMRLIPNRSRAELERLFGIEVISLDDSKAPSSSSSSSSSSSVSSSSVYDTKALIARPVSETTVCSALAPFTTSDEDDDEEPNDQVPIMRLLSAEGVAELEEPPEFVPPPRPPPFIFPPHSSDYMVGAIALSIQAEIPNCLIGDLKGLIVAYLRCTPLILVFGDEEIKLAADIPFTKSDTTNEIKNLITDENESVVCIRDGSAPNTWHAHTTQEPCDDFITSHHPVIDYGDQWEVKIHTWSAERNHSTLCRVGFFIDGLDDMYFCDVFSVDAPATNKGCGHLRIDKGSVIRIRADYEQAPNGIMMLIGYSFWVRLSGNQFKPLPDVSVNISPVDAARVHIYMLPWVHQMAFSIRTPVFSVITP